MSEPLQEPRVVVVKDYETRNRLLGFFSLPMLLFTSTIMVVPFSIFNMLNVGTAVIVTIAAEVLVVYVGLNTVDVVVSEWKQKLRIQKFQWKTVMFGAFVGVFMLVLLQCIAIALKSMGVSLASSNTSTSIGQLDGFWRYFIMLLVAPIVVPFIEEVFFRGYTMGFVQDSFSDKKKGAIVGLIVSSVAFGLAHTQGFSTVSDFFVIVWSTVMGLVTGLFLWRTDSIYPSYALHVTYNLLTVVLIALAW
jgi:membrane protease YdiL (CAAX protease family)